MAYYSDSIIHDVEQIVNIGYIDQQRAYRWNSHRDEGDLRVLTGWYWSSRSGSRREQGGFKTKSAAIRDAYYKLIIKSDAPGISAPRLRRVA